MSELEKRRRDFVKQSKFMHKLMSLNFKIIVEGHKFDIVVFQKLVTDYIISLEIPIKFDLEEM